MRTASRASAVTTLSHEHLGFSTIVAVFRCEDAITIEPYRHLGYESGGSPLIQSHNNGG
jgi:hypothetical protein